MGYDAALAIEGMAHHLAGSKICDSESFKAAFYQPAPVSIRLNSAKLAHFNFSHGVPWCQSGLYLSARPTFTFDPLHHAGAYYVQEASSMAIELAIAACGLAKQNIAALDLCAAPGGKSTHLLSLLGTDSVVVCNETVRNRTLPLIDNLTRWGTLNHVVTSASAQQMAESGVQFDLILADVPCSGEGLIRRDPDAAAHWSPDAVRFCAARQADILQHAWQALAPGGHLIFSTCTFNTIENEGNVARLMAECNARPIPLKIEAEWGIQAAKFDGQVIGYRFMPHCVKGEGFFISLLRKDGDQTAHGGPKGLKIPVPQHLQTYLRTDLHAEVAARETKGFTSISTQKARHWSDQLSKAGIYALRTGIVAFDGDKPTHELVQSTGFNQDRLPSVDVHLAEAIDYLRGNPLKASGANGFATVRYLGLNLGLVKGAGNRWNNLYPAPLRIRDTKTRVEEVVLATSVV